MLNIAVFLIHAFSFLTIGLWLSLLAVRRNVLPKEFLYIGSIASSLVVFYILFYLYLVNPTFADFIAKILYCLAIYLAYRIFVSARSDSTLYARIKVFFLIPLFLVGIFWVTYSTVLYSCMSPNPRIGDYNELLNEQYCHIKNLPPDDILSFVYAENILNNQDHKLFLDWNMVDRPPLQMSSVLPMISQSNNTDPAPYISYHLFSMFLQLSWVAAFYGVFKLLRFSKKFQILSYITLGSIGFFYLNSVFVWPKLLAGSLVFTAILIILTKTKSNQYTYLGAAAVFSSLGLLSHSGVVFALIPVAILLLYRAYKTRKLDIKNIAIAIAITLLLLGPWLVFKNTNVKSDRLIKWHFAGVISPEDKRGTTQTIVEEYKNAGIGYWLHSKKINTETLITGGFNVDRTCSLTLRNILITKCALDDWRRATFFSTFLALEALLVGLILALVDIIRKKADKLDKELVLIGLGGIVIWVLLTFLPGAAIVHAGSYAIMLILFLISLKSLYRLPIRYMTTLTIVQVVIFYFAWIASFLAVG